MTLSPVRQAVAADEAEQAAAASSSGSGDDAASTSQALQEALGVTKTGTCLRHVNCPVLLKNNTIVSCRVCFSEEKSSGITQRKSFTAVVNQLHRMGAALNPDDNQTNADTNADEGTAEEVSPQDNINSALSQSSQVLESLLKRLAQVQNWMLRQKEKEVMSLQMQIHRLEQRVNDQDETITEQKETIRALRKTIQQDLKIIKTMATQKQNEIDAEQQQRQNHAKNAAFQQQQYLLRQVAQAKADTERENNPNQGDEEEEDDDDDEEDDTAAVMYGSPIKQPKPALDAADRLVENSMSLSPLKASSSQQQQNVVSPTATTEGASATSPPPMNQSNDPPLEKFAKRRGKKNLFGAGAGADSGDGEESNTPPPPSRKAPLRRAPMRTLSTQSIDASVTIPEHDVLKDLSDSELQEDSDIESNDDDNIMNYGSSHQSAPPGGGFGTIYCAPNSAGSTGSGMNDDMDDDQNNNKNLMNDDDLNNDSDDNDGLFVPHNPRSSEYWSDKDLSFATNPSNIFASFRGGLLDIPKEPPPPPGHEHKGQKAKLKLKVKLDNQGGLALKLPSMRHIGRSMSGMSDTTGESGLDLARMAQFAGGGGGGGIGAEKRGATGIPLNLLASQLQTLPSLDHSTHRSLDNSIHTAHTAASSSLLNTPGSMADDSPSPKSSSKSCSNTAGVSGSGSNGVQPPPPPLSLLGNHDDEVAADKEEDLFTSSTKKKMNGTTTLPSLNAPLVSPPKKTSVERDVLSSLLSEKDDKLGILKSKDEMKSSGSASPMKSKGLPILVERMHESTADFSSEDPAMTTFSVTRASCQDRYGDPGIYTGTILVTEGLPHGKGTMNYESGRVYDGEWLSGHWNGKGSLLNPNGDTYEGEFVFDARHGHGTYKWDNGDVYVGSFSQDKRHGHGKFSFHNGNVYEGEFVDGMFEGFGKYEFDGGSYEGEWKQGRYEGNGTLKYASGGMYTGEFRNSVAHGFGLEVGADGNKRRGVWENGKPVEFFEKNNQKVKV